MTLGTSDWIALVALIIASGALALEIRRWFESGPRLHLSVMGDMLIVPDDDGVPKLGLFVINRGSTPTVLTHMLVNTYRSRFDYLRGKADITGLVARPNAIPTAPGIPSELGINQTWSGVMHYDEATTAARKKGLLYVGVIASHSNKQYFVRVPPKIDSPKPLETND